LKRGVVISLLVFAGAALLIVGAEAAYRYRNANRGVQVRYYRHSRLQRALVRDADYQGVVHVNHYGFRGADFDSVKAPGATRIIAVGASTTFDPCVKNDRETWTERLEYWLGQQVPGRKFEVLNAGVPGMPMLDHLIRLEAEFYAFGPDVFIVYANHGIVSASDAGLNAVDPGTRPGAAPDISPWETWLREHSRLFERLRPPPAAAAPPESLTAQQWDRAVHNAAQSFHRDLTSFTAVARSMHAQVVFGEINRLTGNRSADQLTAAERAAWQNISATPPEVVLNGYQRFRDVWQAVADSAGAVFVPAEQIGITGAQYFCAGDPIHFNTQGADLMGRRMAEQLLASGVIRRN
jgi:lysophospholipase L1-like esterase